VISFHTCSAVFRVAISGAGAGDIGRSGSDAGGAGVGISP
jgi:hypothetical protein